MISQFSFANFPSLPASLLQIALRIANERYLREHPQLSQMISEFVRRAVAERPERPLNLAVQYFVHEYNPAPAHDSLTDAKRLIGLALDGNHEAIIEFLQHAIRAFSFVGGANDDGAQERANACSSFVRDYEDGADERVLALCNSLDLHGTGCCARAALCLLAVKPDQALAYSREDWAEAYYGGIADAVASLAESAGCANDKMPTPLQLAAAFRAENGGGQLSDHTKLSLISAAFILQNIS